ncbi:MAG: hypothetical protein GX751_05430 [Desulfuromonadaceae bacterium]|nr:hypothetical protein [Desulfuromonadaceae bacterium]
MRVVSLLLLLVLIAGGESAALPVAESSSEAVEIATGPDGLLELERQEKVTVRALHAWERLPAEYLRLAQRMREETSLDLLGANLQRIQEWIVRPEPLPAPIKEALRKLAAFLEKGDYLDWSQMSGDGRLAAGTVARRGGKRWIQPEDAVMAAGLAAASTPPGPTSSADPASARKAATGDDQGELTAPGPEKVAAPAPVFIPDPDFPALPVLAIERQRQLAEAKITAAAGGVIDSGDGLNLRVPPGALDHDRQIVIHAARVPPPSISAGVIGGQTAPLEVLQSWDVDLGPETGLLPEALELSVDVSAYPTERYPLLAPAISTDGRTWTRLPAERRGNNLVFETRHCSPILILTLDVSLFGLAGATAVALPVAALTYLVYDRVDEFPSRYNEHAPFISFNWDEQPEGFEIYWSKKVPGANPQTGFRDEKGYLQALEKLLEPYQGKETDLTTNIRLGFKIRELNRQYLMPESVRKVEEALKIAQRYLKTRNIKKPLLTLPVYIVPSLKENSGHIHNPWSGRRYMILSSTLDERTIYTTVLHELFHHYQTGYVWIDRKGHLPLMEASALLMEREALPHYRNAQPPILYNETEGLALAQFAVFRHGLDGPAQWEETTVRTFGYGLTWFLEYLRDEHWVKREKKKAEDFHAALLSTWGANKYNAIHKALAWAAGGDDQSLAKALADFAENFVLKGPVDKCGSRSPYGGRYNACPLSDSPYGAGFVSQGLPDATVDLSKNPVHQIDDDFIRPWSIQFLKIQGVPGGQAVAAVEIPREWFPAEGSKRSVFSREGAKETDVAEFDDEAPQGSPSAWASLSLNEDAFLYIVDSGQTGSGWVYDYQPARIVLLEPPANIESKMENGKLRLKWQAPAAAKKVAKEMAYFAYIEKNRVGPLTVTGSGPLLEAAIAPEDAPFWSGAETPPVAMVSALIIGQGDDGKTVYLESPRSDITGGGNAGNYRMELSLNSVSKPDQCDEHSKDKTVPDIFFHGFTNQSFTVHVGTDGGFAFSRQWTDSYGEESMVNLTVNGRGTFRDKEVKVEGSYTYAYYWKEKNDEAYQQVDASARFKGGGKFNHGIFFGHKAAGQWSSNGVVHYCPTRTNGKCQGWKTDYSQCSGKLNPVVSSIDSFTRMP